MIEIKEHHLSARKTTFWR